MLLGSGAAKTRAECAAQRVDSSVRAHADCLWSGGLEACRVLNLCSYLVPGTLVFRNVTNCRCCRCCCCLLEYFLFEDVVRTECTSSGSSVRLQVRARASRLYFGQEETRRPLTGRRQAKQRRYTAVHNPINIHRSYCCCLR